MKRLVHLLYCLLAIAFTSGCSGTYNFPTVPFPAPNAGNDTKGVQVWLQGELVGTPTIGSPVESVTNAITPIPPAVSAGASASTPFGLIGTAYDGVVGVKSIQLYVTKAFCGPGNTTSSTTLAASYSAPSGSSYPTTIGLQYNPNVLQDLGNYAEIAYEFQITATTPYGTQAMSQALYYYFTANGQKPSPCGTFGS